MIKRHYFMSVEKPHCDGSGSYSHYSCTADFTSWFSQPSKIYEDTFDHLTNEMKDQKGDKLRVISFNRI